ncbi:MAG TPA: hypothetical protein VIK22_03655 [Candidatus Anoxymicrobiaceae bacterium]
MRFFPGGSFLGGGTKLIESKMPNPFGLFLGAVIVIATATAVGWLTAKFYKERPVLFGVIAALAVCALELFFSIMHLGAIARLVGYAHPGTALNWPYTVMLTMVFVLCSGFAAWGSAGFGMERVSTAGLKKTVMVVGGTVLGLLLLMTVVGGAIRLTRRYTNTGIEASWRWMSTQDAFGGRFMYYDTTGEHNGALLGSIVYTYLGAYAINIADPDTSKSVSHVVKYGDGSYSATGDGEPKPEPNNLGVELLNNNTRPKAIKVTDQFSGTWAGKACTVVEISGDIRDVPILNTIAAKAPGSPTMTPGNSTQYKAYVWTDLGSPKIFLISYQLCAKGGGPGSGGRMDLEF